MSLPVLRTHFSCTRNYVFNITVVMVVYEWVGVMLSYKSHGVLQDFKLFSVGGSY